VKGLEVDYSLCVIGGLGHAGLPLSVVFACRGQRVLIYDRNTRAAEVVRAGRMPFVEERGEEHLREALASGNLDITDDIRAVSKARTVCVVIGTPVDDHLNPALEDVTDLVDELMPHLVDGQVVMLRSTVFPGTTQLIAERIAKRGKRVHVTFCPERIAEGRAFVELRHLPQIISGFDDEGLRAMRELFACLGCEIVELSPMEAELGKLFTNAWRYCQFAVSNQFYVIANNYNLDFYRIYDAITHGYPRISGMARAGFAAGPCLFKDTLQLAAFNNNAFALGYAAMTTNEGLPNHLVERLKLSFPLKQMTVGLLGMAFKADNDDKRGSLAFKMRRILQWEAADVLCTDVYLQETGFLPVDEVVRRSDLLILTCPHREYRQLELGDKPVVDVWNFFGKGGAIPR